jgi:hypothetical protein
MLRSGKEVLQEDLSDHHHVRVALFGEDVVQYGPDDVFGRILEFLSQPYGERPQSL